MNTPTNHEQLSKQEAGIWTLLQTMNSSQNKGEIWTLLQTMNSSQNKRVKYEHSYKPWTALKISGRNMNTPTNHEQLKKQETEIWTLLQTMNSFQNKRQKYEHSYKYEICSEFGNFVITLISYKPWTAHKTRGRNMNTPTNHEQLSK